jgi:membrane protein
LAEKTFTEKLIATRVVRIFFAILKKLILPGFGGMSLYDVSAFFVKGLMEGAITTRASSLAFNFFLAFFPSMIFLFTLIPHIPINNFQEELFLLMQDILPPSTYDATKSTLNDIINNEHGGLMSIGFVLALYFSTNGINSLIEAFNASAHQKETRTLLKQRMVSLALTLINSLMLLVAVSMIIFTQAVTSYLVDLGYLEAYTALILNGSKWGILLVLLYFGISVLFYWGPSGDQKWRFFSPGSIMATVLTVITSAGFSYYVSNFAQYNKLYGSIGTLLVILLWIYFNAIILLLGFELNASIVRARVSTGKKRKD